MCTALTPQSGIVTDNDKQRHCADSFSQKKQTFLTVLDSQSFSAQVRCGINTSTSYHYYLNFFSLDQIDE